MLIYIKTKKELDKEIPGRTSTRDKRKFGFCGQTRGAREKTKYFNGRRDKNKNVEHFFKYDNTIKEDVKIKYNCYEIYGGLFVEWYTFLPDEIKIIETD